VKQIRRRWRRPPPTTTRRSFRSGWRSCRRRRGHQRRRGDRVRDEGEEGARRGRPARDRAAVEEGIVAGGGVAYIRAASSLDGLKLEHDQQAGVDIVRKALVEPAKQIAINAGQDAASSSTRSRRGRGTTATTRARRSSRPDEGWNPRSDKVTAWRCRTPRRWRAS